MDYQEDHADHCYLLGVDEDASQEEIKQAFWALAKELHPDVNTSAYAREEFLKLTAAYNALRRAPHSDAHSDIGMARPSGFRAPPPRATRSSPSHAWVYGVALIGALGVGGFCLANVEITDPPSVQLASVETAVVQMPFVASADVAKPHVLASDPLAAPHEAEPARSPAKAKPSVWEAHVERRAVPETQLLEDAAASPVAVVAKDGDMNDVVEPDDAARPTATVEKSRPAKTRLLNRVKLKKAKVVHAGHRVRSRSAHAGSKKAARALSTVRKHHSRSIYAKARRFYS